MTEQMAIETIEYIKTFDGMNFGKTKIALEMAIKALEENQQYKALGTVEELRVVKELYDITTPLSVTEPSITIKNIDALNCILGQKDFYDEEFEKALRDSVKALEKQIPKKCKIRDRIVFREGEYEPIKIKSYRCPICNHETGTCGVVPNYCMSCGHKLESRCEDDNH